jgi:hypothetical protein
MEGRKMAAKKGRKRKEPAAKPDDEETTVAEEKGGQEEEKAPTETRKPSVTGQEEVERERQARFKAEKDAKDVLAATQEEVEQEHQARIKAEKALTDAKEALAAAMEEVEEERKARSKVEQTLIEAKETSEATETQAEQERQARAQIEETLTETKEALATAQRELKRERQARSEAEQARADAEEASAEAMKAARVKAENTEPPPTAPEQGAEERVSFLIKVTHDEQGRFRYSEIEPSKKDREPKKFVGLAGHGLVGYMEEHIRSLVVTEPITPPTPAPASIEPEVPQPLQPTTNLTISEVQVFRLKEPGVPTLFLSPEEAFLIQVLFQLEGPEAPSFVAQGSPFEVTVLAHERTSGTSKSLTTYRATLVEGVLEYTTHVKGQGLLPGFYRLVSKVTLQDAAKMRDQYEGPMLQVIGAE